MATSEEIFRDAMALTPDARAELTERLVESLALDISSEVTEAQLAEVRRRIAQVESGEVELIPGDEVLARARRLLATCSDNDEDVAEALRRDSEIDADPNAAISLTQLDMEIQSQRK